MFAVLYAPYRVFTIHRAAVLPHPYTVRGGAIPTSGATRGPLRFGRGPVVSGSPSEGGTDDSGASEGGFYLGDVLGERGEMANPGGLVVIYGVAALLTALVVFYILTAS